MKTLIYIYKCTASRTSHSFTYINFLCKSFLGGLMELLINEADLLNEPLHHYILNFKAIFIDEDTDFIINENKKYTAKYLPANNNGKITLFKGNEATHVICPENGNCQIKQ